MSSPREKMTEVAENHVWRERVKKELSIHKLNDTFMINPRTQEYVTPKIGERGNRFLDRDEALLKSLNKTLQRMSKEKTRRERRERGAPSENMSSTMGDSDLDSVDEEFSSTLKKTFQTPQERYRIPQTTQQDIGWFHDPITSKASQFYRPHIQSDETKFAEHLIRSSTTVNKGGQDTS